MAEQNNDSTTPLNEDAPSQNESSQDVPKTDAPAPNEAQPVAAQQDDGEAPPSESGDGTALSPEAAKAQQQAHMGQFRARPASVSDKPRRVRAGRKLNLNDWPQRLGWAGTRWIESIKARIPAEVLREGLDYAERGQTRRLETVVSAVSADVQGRPYRPYTTELLLRPFPHEKWDDAVRELVKSSVHAAKLLSGEMAEEIQSEIFDSLDLDLFPTGDVDEIKCVCNCRETDRWCKHGACIAMQLAEDIDADPFLLFRLRGLEGVDLIEKLRQRRELENTGSSKPASALRLPFPGDETAAPALEACVDEFWDTPAGLDDIETTPRRPEVAHALLRRLGPTPFEGARFPLSGLLATCYDTFTREAMSERNASKDQSDSDEPSTTPEPEPEASKGPQLSAAARMLRAKVAGKAGAKAKPKAGIAARRPDQG